MSDFFDTFDISRGAAGHKLARGRISKVVGTDVYAILPSFNSKHEFGPMKFPVAGIAVNDSVLVGFDEQGTPWVAGWQGVAAGATGAAGGVLSGTYPNPGFATSPSFTGTVTAGGGALVVSGGASVSLKLTRTSGGVVATTHDFTSTLNGATYQRLTGGVYTGERAGTSENATPIYERRVPALSTGSASWAIGRFNVAAGTPFTNANEDDWITAGPSGIALLKSTAMSGTPTAPSAALHSNGTQIATCAFVFDNDRVTIADTRATEETPNVSNVYQRTFRAEFKSRTSITGAPGTGSFGILTTYAGWSDDSGGGVKQTWLDDSNPPRLFVRRGTIAGGWSAWQEVASLASPTFTGTPAAPTAAVGTNTTQLATTAFVQSKVKIGRSTQTPGAVTTVNIAHGLGYAPAGAVVTPGDANARGAPASFVTVDATNVILTFVAALTAATSYTWNWTAGT